MELGLIQSLYVDVSELDHGLRDRSLVLGALPESLFLDSATVARREIPHSLQEKLVVSHTFQNASDILISSPTVHKTFRRQGPLRI